MNLKYNDTVKTKKTRLTLIVSNLISNAIKYQDLEKEDPYIEISTFESDGKFVFEIQDNGLGIGEEYRDRLFQMFQRLHVHTAVGSGLGLYMVKKSAELINAKLSYEPLKEGSLFKVII